MIFSHAVRQADVEPGRQNTNVPLASPANARDCSDEVAISSKLIARNSSPKPGISLYSRGTSASGLESTTAKPVPTVTAKQAKAAWGTPYENNASRGYIGREAGRRRR